MTPATDTHSTFDPEAMTRILHEAGVLAPERRVLTVTSEPMDGGYLSDLARLKLAYDGPRRTTRRASRRRPAASCSSDRPATSCHERSAR